ncbi:MAG TPA: TetR/AcrR family transcriptional regulator [Burkholderiales bacterium]|nr:TetR/AcrR family transcriptional regulator [Burkholderiales bacterium]
MHKPPDPEARILAAANKLFYHQGIRAVGVDTVAAEAGVSKRTLYNYYPTKDKLIAAYLTSRFKLVPPSDAPAREQILGYFDRLEAMFADGGFRGCPYVNAVTELGDRKHPATGIAVQFKDQRLAWYRALLERMGVPDPEGLALQLQLLVEGALVTALVREDPSVAKAARAAAEALLNAASKHPGSPRSAASRRRKR